MRGRRIRTWTWGWRWWLWRVSSKSLAHRSIIFFFWFLVFLLFQYLLIMYIQFLYHIHHLIKKIVESVIILWENIVILHFHSLSFMSNIGFKRLIFSSTLFELGPGKNPHSQFTLKKTSLILRSSGIFASMTLKQIT